MLMFLVGLVLFIGIHLLRALAPAARQGMIDSMGANAFRGLYSVVTIASFCLLVYGFGEARLDTGILYEPPVFLRHLTLLLMLVAMIVLVAGFLPTGYIALYTKHPQVLSVKIWAFAHLLANGETAQVILFAAFLAWGVVMRISLKRRERSGEITPKVFQSARYDLFAVVGGLLIYGLFVMKLHTWLIGVSVM